MAPRAKKTKNVSIAEDTLKIRPIVEISEEQETSEQDSVKHSVKKKLPQHKSDTNMQISSLGATLRHARQAKHMKLPSISKKLRIKELYLEALEKGDYHIFPALVYGIGFLRTYAIFLDLNPDEMIALFHKETSYIKEEPLDTPRSCDIKVLPSREVSFISLFILFMLYLFWNVYKIMTNNPLADLPTPVVETTETVLSSDEPAPITADEIADSTVVETTKIEKEAPLPSNTDSKKSKHTPVVYGLKTPAKIAFIATDKTSVEVRDTEANRVLFKKDLDIGDRYHPNEDSEGLTLKTTNAGGLDVYLDEKKIKTLGKKGQTKSNIQLNADYLLKD